MQLDGTYKSLIALACSPRQQTMQGVSGSNCNTSKITTKMPPSVNSQVLIWI